jgi:hypothetical protein
MNHSDLPEPPVPPVPPAHLSHSISIPAPITHADGSVTFNTEQGASITTHPDGKVSLDFKQIKNIGIHNIIEVQTYNIHSVLGMVSHFVKFHHGGELRFAYNQAGQLIELSFFKLHVNIVDGQQVMFSAHEMSA